ncbi:uncharacterized protein BXZ73DRAFT_80858 [Epithele typhae]|uniref:uncharacterized protein n=1 Tax=Epithele typhae TaxID=378194 RepID=UPI002007D24B|nr:uncharacterized protein BXZ73DRAFT_80858 [Epithele typhae]KAH9917094.1 hypothetical protein BXZ73DRAFT_80858 [Epithele typhae]
MPTLTHPSPLSRPLRLSALQSLPSAPNVPRAHGHPEVSRVGGHYQLQLAPAHDVVVARLAPGLQALRVGSADGTDGLEHGEHPSRSFDGQETRARLAQDRPAASGNGNAAPRGALSSRGEDVTTARTLGVWEASTTGDASSAHPSPSSRLSLPPWPLTPPSNLSSPPLSSPSAAPADTPNNDGVRRGSLASSIRSSGPSFSFSPSGEGASLCITPATSPGSDVHDELPVPAPPRARVRFYRAPSTTLSTSTSTTVTHTSTSTATPAAPYHPITPFLASLPHPHRWDLREALPHDLLRDTRCEEQAFGTGFSRCKIVFNAGSNAEFFAHCTPSERGPLTVADVLNCIAKKLAGRCNWLFEHEPVGARAGQSGRARGGEATYADLLDGDQCFLWGLKETGASQEFAVVLGGRRHRPV